MLWRCLVGGCVLPAEFQQVPWRPSHSRLGRVAGCHADHMPEQTCQLRDVFEARNTGKHSSATHVGACSGAPPHTFSVVLATGLASLVRGLTSRGDHLTCPWCVSLRPHFPQRYRVDFLLRCPLSGVLLEPFLGFRIRRALASERYCSCLKEETGRSVTSLRGS